MILWVILNLRYFPIQYLPAGESGEWLVDDTQDCLQVLLELKELEDTIQVEWPEGEKLGEYSAGVRPDRPVARA